VIFARGSLRSCRPDEIVARIKADLAEGAQEFWLTSQDTGCYGKDIGTNLADLLETVCTVPGDFKVRVGMMTPNYANSILGKLVSAYKNPKVFKFLHLPMQSGDNSILKRMRRGYTVADFGKVVEAFRMEFPMITLATDVICGFPGETRQASEKTLAAIGKFEPDVVNVSRFFARPGTVAAKMPNEVDPVEMKLRSAQMSELSRRLALARNQRWVDWTGEVLVDEKGKRNGSWIGRNYAYKPIVVKNTLDLLGKIVRVKVVKAYSTYLFAEIL
jgi:MiaB/RimO family radical SAM methylthiotransferase